MTVVWSPRAIRPLGHIRKYTAQNNPAAAARVSAKILESVTVLAEHPHIGRPGRVPGTRELVVPATPYLVPYRVRGDRLEIIAVFHGRQRWPERL